MTKENWVQLLVPLASVVGAVVVAALTYYFTKKTERQAAERILKENFYLNFLAAASGVIVLKHSDESKERLADAFNQLLIVGSSDVIQKLMAYRNHIITGEEGDPDSSKHDELLTSLIKSMRFDLYRSKNVNDNYPTIGFSGT